jgi:hypothetical protein
VRPVELSCGDDPAAWAALGFAVSDGELVHIGHVTVRCDGQGGGLRSWRPSARESDPVVHPNGAVEVDHVVLLTDDRDRSAAGLVEAGGDERRRTGPPEVPVPMAFVHVDGVIVEVAEAGGPERLWGLTVVVPDPADLGPLVGPAKDAVQPGRRIATVRAREGLETALAFMSPRVRTR